MIISIAFPYPNNDIPFTEELESKIGNLRSITTAYFSSLPTADFDNFNEDYYKGELLKRYNGILRLGKISELYFNDFLIIDAQAPSE
jgi:flagellar basal body-associated protein FliL